MGTAFIFICSATPRPNFRLICESGPESGPVVVEINPRLTTSYVGLRQSLALNPAELIVSIWQNGAMPEVHKDEFLPVNLLLEEANVV